MSIPKIVWQINKEPYEELPPYIRIMTETWKQDGWDFRYMSNQQASQWIFDTYGLLYRDMYDSISMPSCKSDFWRYLVLNAYGGLYVDIDTVCLEPMDTWLNLDYDLNVSTEFFSEIGHQTYGPWLIASTPNNKFMTAMIDHMAKEIDYAMKNNLAITPDHVGPIAWTKVLSSMIDDSVNIINVPGNVHHYMGNISWSDTSGRTIESLLWNVDNYDIKLMNYGYNSVGDEITWA